MSFSKNSIIALTLVALTAANPIARDTSSVSVVSKTVQSQHADQLPSIGSISQDVKSFLDKYQPNSLAAAIKANSANLTAYPASGLCSKEYPCFAVDKVATTAVGSSAGLNAAQAGALLDQILSQPELKFAPNSLWSTAPSLDISTNDLTFAATGIEETIESKLMAGAVMDLFKAQGLDKASNAIRGVSASESPETLPVIGLCVYPKSADLASVAKFCQGHDNSKSLAQRDGSLLGGMHDFFCGIPLISFVCG